MSDASKNRPIPIPSLQPREEPAYVTCPFCTMQMPSGSKVCPHCSLQNPLTRDFRELLVPEERFPRLMRLLRAYWQQLALGGGILLVFLVAAVVYYGWFGHPVSVVRNPAFKLSVTRGIQNGKVVLRGTVTNLGEDIPELSLKSIRVNADFRMKEGGVRRESAYPRSRYRGEGALMKGETGDFRIETQADGVESASLSTEVVDLTCGQPSQRCPLPSKTVVIPPR
jgi:hypothetical protein